MVGPRDNVWKVLRATDGERFVLAEQTCDFPKEF
jgi:hypothetical protein